MWLMGVPGDFPGAASRLQPTRGPRLSALDGPDVVALFGIIVHYFIENPAGCQCEQALSLIRTWLGWPEGSDTDHGIAADRRTGFSGRAWPARSPRAGVARHVAQGAGARLRHLRALYR